MPAPTEITARRGWTRRSRAASDGSSEPWCDTSSTSTDGGSSGSTTGASASAGSSTRHAPHSATTHERGSVRILAGHHVARPQDAQHEGAGPQREPATGDHDRHVPSPRVGERLLLELLVARQPRIEHARDVEPIEHVRGSPDVILLRVREHQGIEAR